jgi:thioredoxin reductase (NADPH)
VNLSSFANCVTLLVRGDALEKSMSHYLIEQLKTKANVRVETRSEVSDAFGDNNLEAIAVVNGATGDTVRRDASVLFIMIGADAQTAWLPETLPRDQRDYIITGPEVQKAGRWVANRDPYLLETAVPGIFAIGDVRSGSVKRVAAGAVKAVWSSRSCISIWRRPLRCEPVRLGGRRKPSAERRYDGA